MFHEGSCRQQPFHLPQIILTEQSEWAMCKTAWLVTQQAGAGQLLTAE